MEEILRDWEARSKSTKTLYAKFTRDDVIDDWDETTRYDGAAFLQSPNLAYLNFEKVAADGKKTFSERIVCTGDRVYQFLADSKQVHLYALSQEDRLKAMEEGPLPFLFNMNAANAKQRYRMGLLEENADLALVAIYPLQDVDREAFSRAYVWLNKGTFLPTKIQLMDPSNAKNSKTFKFSDVRRNVEVKPTYFDGLGQSRGVAQAGWDIVSHGPDGKPIASAVPKGAAPAAAPTAPAAAGTRPVRTGAAPAPGAAQPAPRR
jgi:TIGR03009 family protein